MPKDCGSPKPGSIPSPLVRLAATPSGGGGTATANVRLTIGGQPAHLEIALPDGPAHLRELLPVFQGLTDLVVDVAVQAVERQGQQVSCRKGCGACCR